MMGICGRIYAFRISGNDMQAGAIDIGHIKVLRKLDGCRQPFSSAVQIERVRRKFNRHLYGHYIHFALNGVGAALVIGYGQRYDVCAGFVIGM